MEGTWYSSYATLPSARYMKYIEDPEAGTARAFAEQVVKIDVQLETMRSVRAENGAVVKKLGADDTRELRDLFTAIDSM